MASDDEQVQRYERDLFGDDNDDGASIHSDAEDRGDRDKNQSGSDKGSGEENRKNDDDDKAKDKIQKPKRDGPVKHFMLDEDRLCGKNGLIKIEETFKDFKFLGKGHEQKDLDRMLHKLEHWVHVLHPRFPFDQTLERIEFLGTKKPRVKTYIKKIRMGMITSAQKEDEFLNLDNDFSEDENVPNSAEPQTETQQSGEPGPVNQEMGDEFADDFPDIPDDMFLDDDFE